ncbi:peroxidase family protein [Streptomyces sp. NPDC002130]|uniref:peroxidase family protein n=1 Tax=Streptomyces sp. NPDC002130 TaxID=3155568 RepID=UPI0033226896
MIYLAAVEEAVADAAVLGHGVGGLSLFVKQHNAICDHLHAAYPSWDDEELFQRARLVNSALIAEIHTVDRTPAVLSRPTTVKALRTNWWGIAGNISTTFSAGSAAASSSAASPGLRQFTTPTRRGPRRSSGCTRTTLRRLTC